MIDDYILKVTAGSDYNPEKHKLVEVNDEKGMIIESELAKIKLIVRIDNFDGISTKHINTSPYFEHKKDLYSIEFQVLFKAPINANLLLFGNDFDTKLNLPPGVSILTKFAYFIDPCMEIDLYSDKPSAFSPVLYTMNTIQTKNSESFIEGEIEEDFTLNELKIKDSSERKERFKKEENREEIIFYKKTILRCDFANAYIDFYHRSLNTPVYNLNVMKFWNGSPLRYVLKSKNGDIFFVLIFDLVKYEKDEMDVD